MNKKLYLIFAVIIIVLYLVVSVVFLLFPAKEKTPTSEVTPTNVPTTLIPTKKSTIDRLKEKAAATPLSSEEKTNRSSLISKADTSTGYITVQPTFALVYLKDQNIFQARILTGNLSQAREAISIYLASQGFEGKSICKLPLFYYIHPRLLAANETFNPIPEECR